MQSAALPVASSSAVISAAEAIPITSRDDDPAILEAAYTQINLVLRDKEVLGIFPEGAITRDGQLQPFKGGVKKILDRAEAEGLSVPVVPMALTHLWGSFFSRVEVRDGENVAMVRPFRRGLWSRVGLKVGRPVPAAQAQPEELHRRVGELLGGAA